MYGAAGADVARWCESRGIPLHRFDWDEAHGRAGLAQNALYLLRPDTYVGLAAPAPSAASLEAYGTERGLASAHRHTREP